MHRTKSIASHQFTCANTHSPNEQKNRSIFLLTLHQKRWMDFFPFYEHIFFFSSKLYVSIQSMCNSRMHTSNRLKLIVFHRHNGLKVFACHVQ